MDRLVSAINIMAPKFMALFIPSQNWISCIVAVHGSCLKSDSIHSFWWLSCGGWSAMAFSNLFGCMLFYNPAVCPVNWLPSFALARIK